MRVALVAGERSGDELGAGLISALRELIPSAEFEGVCGVAMRDAGCHMLEDAESLAVMGLIEPLSEIPRLLRLQKMLLTRWVKNPPDIFIGIDAPDFNLRLEAKLKKAGIATIHYVSPSVWAWRQGRARMIAQATDRVLCLLPFEKAFYDERGIAADFVGHPLADQPAKYADQQAAQDALGIKASKLIALLPGSRAGEVSKLAPVFLQAAMLLVKEFPELQFVAPMASEKVRDIFTAIVAETASELPLTITMGQAEAAMSASDLVLLASGTATLQCALLERPMVAAYKLAPLTYAIAKGLNLVKAPYFTLPNLLTDEPLVPEYLQQQASAENLAKALGELLRDAAKRQSIAEAFHVLRETLAQDANRSAARSVVDVVEKTRRSV